MDLIPPHAHATSTRGGAEAPPAERPADAKAERAERVMFTLPIPCARHRISRKQADSPRSVRSSWR